jgi:SAM-dependent methyltransferase
MSGLHDACAPRRWRTWPIPALAAWSLAWLMYGLLGAIGLSPWLGLSVGTGMGLWLSRFGATRMRSLAIAAGFPLSLLASDAAGALPAWAWLLPLALLWLLYPRRAWHDAPLFPTPPRALDALPAQILLAPGARVLDAGCGLGHGLRALRRAYPQARLEGVEGSWPLVLAARAACRFAAVHHADMWSQSWAGFELVYLFQRPESMPRALAKAAAEMAPGGWVASLEFEAEGWAPQALLRCPDGRPLWLYRLPLRVTGAPASSDAAAGR